MEMSSHSCLVSLLGSLPDQKSSLHSLLQRIENKAMILVDSIGKASANGSIPKPSESGPSKGEAAEVVSSHINI